MRELKCPKCGNVFSVDEADYAIIANQVKNNEFNEEVRRRMAELHQQQQLMQDKEKAELEKIHQQQLNKNAQELGRKELEIAQLKQKLENAALQKITEINQALADKDKTISDLQTKLNQNANQQRIAVLEEQKKNQDALNLKNVEIERLKASIQAQKVEDADK